MFNLSMALRTALAAGPQCCGFQAWGFSRQRCALSIQNNFIFKNLFCILVFI